MGKKKKVQFPTECDDNTILSELTYQKRQYFCKHALSSILSQPHEEGKSLKGKYTVHCRLFVNEVKFFFDTIFHIYNMYKQTRLKVKKRNLKSSCRKSQLSPSLNKMLKVSVVVFQIDLSHVHAKVHSVLPVVKNYNTSGLFQKQMNLPVIHKNILK